MKQDEDGRKSSKATVSLIVSEPSADPMLKLHGLKIPLDVDRFEHRDTVRGGNYVEVTFPPGPAAEPFAHRLVASQSHTGGPSSTGAAATARAISNITLLDGPSGSGGAGRSRRAEPMGKRALLAIVIKVNGKAWDNKNAWNKNTQDDGGVVWNDANHAADYDSTCSSETAMKSNLWGTNANNPANTMRSSWLKASFGKCESTTAPHPCRKLCSELERALMAQGIPHCQAPLVATLKSVYVASCQALCFIPPFMLSAPPS